MGKYLKLILKRGNKISNGGMKTPRSVKNQVALRKKENYKYLEILEKDTIKQSKMKKKMKNTKNERESFSKPSTERETSLKGLTPEPFCYILT